MTVAEAEKVNGAAAMEKLTLAAAVAGVAVGPAELVEAQYPQPSEACSQRGWR